jgi:hypothetical protein
VWSFAIPRTRGGGTMCIGPGVEEPGGFWMRARGVRRENVITTITTRCNGTGTYDWGSLLSSVVALSSLEERGETTR